MAFWSDKSLDPKRQFRFKVVFPQLNTLAGNESTFLAQYADRPQYTIKGDTKVHYLDKEFNFPGKVSWNQVKIRFVDSIVDAVNVSSRVYQYLGNAGWISPSKQGGNINADSFKTISKPKAVDATRGDVRIDVLNADGAPIDSWVLRNAFVTSVAMNNLEYSADGILTAEYTFVYDWADYT